MTFGERIYKIRTQKGLTQDELAQAVGYKSRSTIAKIESGERDAPQTMIVALAKALGTTPSYLMGWDEIEETLDFLDTITDPEHTSEQVKENDAKIRERIVELRAQDLPDKTEQEVKLIARKTKDLPEEDREALLELLNSTVDTFLKAKGIKND